MKAYKMKNMIVDEISTTSEFDQLSDGLKNSVFSSIEKLELLANITELFSFTQLKTEAALLEALLKSKND